MKNLIDWLQGLGFLTYALVIFGLFLKLAEQLAPTVTATVALILTLSTIRETSLFCASLIGAGLFVLSWPITQHHGPIAGMMVWAVGLTLWTLSVFNKKVFG